MRPEKAVPARAFGRMPMGSMSDRSKLTSEKLTNEMVRRLIPLREQVDRGGSF